MQLDLTCSRTLLALLLCFSSPLTIACKGDKGDSGGNGGEGGTLVGPQGLSCEEDSECDDHIFCNGQESCDQGVCRHDERVTCSDGIACTIDRCDESASKCVSTAPDEDSDGFGDASCEDKNGAPLGQDCDDHDELSFPGNVEVCDPEFRDEDCDPTTIGSRDADHDGYLDALCCNVQPDGDKDCGKDCDDNKANVNPESPEVCDFLDNDCNDDVDEGVTIDMYRDGDFDGHGNPDEPTKTCAGAVGVSGLNDDCNDADPEVFLGQFEICDDKDNNCDPDGLIDEVKEYAPWYKDEDDDSFGDPESTPIFSCYRPAGRVLSQNDCSDHDKKVNPAATEICDGKDNDCNGWPDAKVSGINNFEDDDRDGVADADCGGDDCDDTDPRTAGGAEEVCDHIDNDCNGEVDEQTVQNIWYIDNDGDGWGVVIGSALASCDPLADRASKFGDCNDGESGIHPEVTELCDDKDNDCDGQTDEGASVFCKANNAVSTCSQGECQILTCTPGFVDSDNDYENGCESPVTPVLGDQCSLDSECTDNNLCNGIESCVSVGDGRQCKQGPPINCNLGGTVIDGDVAIHNGLDIQAIAGVNTITGNLDISYTDLTSLVGLESLRTIGGSLFVRGNSALRKLSGSALSNLEIVGGVVQIQDNLALTNVDLPSLRYANGIDITENEGLLAISGYDELVEVGEFINIRYNFDLESITGFNALSTMGGAYNVYWGDGDNVCQGNGGLLIRDNIALTEFAGFASLERSAGDVCVLDLGSEADNGGGSTETQQAAFPAEAATASSVVTFPALREVEGGIEVSYSSQLNAISFPELRDAEFLSVGSSSWTETAFNDTFAELSLPQLRDVRYFQLNGNCGFERLNAPRLTTAYYLFLDANCNDTASASAELNLTALESVNYLSLYVYSDPSGTRPVVMNVPALTEVEQLSLNAYGDGVTDFTFPELQRVNWLYATFSSSTLESLRFPKLETASTINLSVQPSEGKDPPTALQLVDFSELKSVDTIYLTAPIAATGQDSGLRMPSLGIVGSYDYNEDSEPDNNGVAQICTGYSASDEPPYINAACNILQKLVNSGYSGEPDTCGQCDLDEPTASLKAEQVVASYEHSCALLTDGTVSCWGKNNAGVLGALAGPSEITPIAVPNLNQIVEIAGGQSHMCAVDYEGVVLCWGDNTWGQLGTDQVPVGQSSATPMYVQGLSSVEHITSGRDHMCAINSSAEILCWGHNNYGQLGIGSSDSRPHLPTRVPFLNTLQVSAAGDYTCAIDDSEGVGLYCWGYGADGQLGYNTVQACDSSFCATADNGYVSGFSDYPNAIWTGERHACAKTVDGNFYCWGSDVTGAMPLSGKIYDTPQLMPTDVYATRSLGDGFSCGVNAGSAYCWGSNEDMQAGQATGPYYDDKVGFARFESPVPPKLVPDLPLMDRISAGARHACGISINQEVYCWGYSEYGRVGRDDFYYVDVGEFSAYAMSLPPGLVSIAGLEPNPNQ